MENIVNMQLDNMENMIEDLVDVMELTRLKTNSYLELMNILEENNVLFPIPSKIPKKIEKIVMELNILINHMEKEEQSVKKIVSTKFWLRLQGVGLN